MKVYFDAEKLAITNVDMEDEVVFKGDLTTTLEVIANDGAIADDHYVVVACKLANGREIGPFLYDEYGTSHDQALWVFTMSADAGFRFVDGNTILYIWLCDATINNVVGKRKCLGAVSFNVANAVAYGDSSYFIQVSDDEVEDILNNMASQIEQLQTQVGSILPQYMQKITLTSSSGTLTGAQLTSLNERALIVYNNRVYICTYKNGTYYEFTNVDVTDEDYSVIYYFAINNGNYDLHSYNARYLTTGSVGTTDIEARAVTGGKIALATIETENIKDEAITNDKLANDSIDKWKIRYGAVTNDKLGDNVSYNKLVDKPIYNITITATTTIENLILAVGDTTGGFYLINPIGSFSSNVLKPNYLIHLHIERGPLAVSLIQIREDETKKCRYSSASSLVLTGWIVVDTLKMVTPAEKSQITTNANDIDAIESKIPSEASSSNKLADKAYVNDQINSVSAYYITADAEGDAFASVAALTGATTYYSGGVVRVPTRNDYAYVMSDENHDGAATRYSYQNNQWEFQFIINESPMTQAQVNALNSGITAAKVSSYDAHLGNTNNPHSVTKAQVGLGNVDNTSDLNKPVSTAQQAALALKLDKTTFEALGLSVVDGCLCQTYQEE